MGRLTTHVLDVSAGRPAAGVRVRVVRDGVVLADAATNGDGRCEAPLVEGAAFLAGVYELVFSVGDYFGLVEPRFLEEVVIRFGVTDAQAHWHVPLLVTPWSYSTYRGS